MDRTFAKSPSAIFPPWLVAQTFTVLPSPESRASQSKDAPSCSIASVWAETGAPSDDQHTSPVSVRPTARPSSVVAT